MAKPKYFRDFPNIKYALRVNKAGQTTGIEIKDYFNLLQVRDDIFKKDTIYSPYIIKNGQRPDQISYDYYGDEQFYWIILQINNITDYWSQWPLSQNELDAFIPKKYGGAENASRVKYYETVDTFDDSDPKNLVLRGGLKVPESYLFYYPSSPGSGVTLTSKPIPITFNRYERRLNELKSQIYVLDKKYVWEYETEVRNYARNLEPLASFVDISTTLRPTY